MKCFYKTCPRHAGEKDECTNKANVCTATRLETAQYRMDKINLNIPKPKKGFRHPW